MKGLIKKLDTYAYKNGKDFANVFDTWLDWTIDHWSLDTVLDCKCDLSAVVERMRNDNPTFCECYTDVVAYTAKETEKRGWCDAFGTLYEEKVKSGYKASKMGQFFTPEHLCGLLSEVTVEEDKHAFAYDPCCGSGRLLLAAYAKFDKSKFNYFVAGDLDGISCKMTAINMMMHGMFGIVERRNALTGEFFNGYIVNELCYPIPLPCPSIRKADEDECRKNLEYARSIIPKKTDTAPPKPQPLNFFNF